MIEVENLTKYFGPKMAIHDVSFRAEPGEIMGLLGPNGAGKTTTMRILTGYFPPTSGRARVAGYDVVEQSLEIRKRLGYLPENVPLYTDMTVRAYLDFVARAKAVRNAQRSISRAMEVCRVEDRADWVIGKLSKGYRQRVGLAQALLGDPPVLILDEPTVGLDPKQIIETRRLIRELGGERTIILSTHILPEVSMTCSRVAIINAGTIVAVDTPDNLTRRLTGADRVTLQVRGPVPAVERRLRKVPGVLHVTTGAAQDGLARVDVDVQVGRDLREELAAAVVEEGWGLRELRSVSLSLEEVFLKLTTEEEVTEEVAVEEAEVAVV